MESFLHKHTVASQKEDRSKQMGRIRFPPAFIVSCVKTLRLLTKASVMRVKEGGRERGIEEREGRGWRIPLITAPCPSPLTPLT